MKYKLLAIDIDGTLVRPDQTIAPEVVEAISLADRAGLRVCLATGRSHVESLPVWRQLRLSEPYQPMVIIGGALVSEPDSGRTLYQKTIPAGDADEFSRVLGERGYSALAIVDAWRHGLDYLLVESADVQSVHARWFAKMPGVRIRRVKDLAGHNGDGSAANPPSHGLPAALRINAVVDSAAGPAMAAELAERFAGRLNVHSILAPNYGATVVEAFSSHASKWTALMYIAQAMRVGPGQIAAVGDDVNDLAMISAAGLGVAMPQAPPQVAQAAKHVATDGLAAFVRQLVAGRFD